ESPQKTSEAALKEYREADLLYKNKKQALALKKLATLVQRNPKTDVANDSLYLMGQIYYEQGDYFRGARFWQAVVDSPVASRWADRAAINGAQAFSQMGHYDDALRLLSKIRTDQPTSPALASQALELSSRLRLLKADASGALQDLVRARQLRSSPVEQQALMNRAIEVINGNLSMKQLDEALSNSNLSDLE